MHNLATGVYAIGHSDTIMPNGLPAFSQNLFQKDFNLFAAVLDAMNTGVAFMDHL